MRGGKRPGAGRPQAGTKDVRIRLTDEEHKILTSIGGSAWIRGQIQLVKEHKMKVKIDTSKFTEEQENKFIEGWESAGGTTSDLEDDSPNPWCCPWYWNPVIEVEGTTPEEWGASWWLQCKPEIDRLLAEWEKEKVELEE